ncbi:hypothetical protein [Pseudacidovorax sp. NFM-22]|uniref:hypothetical protein n=1 Tax=Pseudacidovorax sp. NFM-22 TaxID=2744469 RepID=UPI001F356882|nr:hypothetical protein [Pseudacidovorax sp. NFM-22]
MSQRGAARQLGVSERMMRYYCASRELADHTDAPYCVQFALESLASFNERQEAGRTS